MPTIVITGASQGIGRAIALAFAAEPESRLVLMARNEEKLEAVAEECAEAGGDAVVFPCDVTDDDALADCAQAVLTEWGAPDVVVNNAGQFEPGSSLEMTPQVFRDQIEANLTSAFLVTRAFLPSMVERGTGHVFYMASIASVLPYPRGIGYGAGKHGMLGLARTVREEMKEKGIRVTTILPGPTYTDSWSASGISEDRFMPPEDVATMVLQAFRLSERTVVEEIVMRPQLGDL